MRLCLILASITFVLFPTALYPAPDLESERIALLIGQLDDDGFSVREAATRELAQLGERAVPALERALEKSTSLEQRKRIEALLHDFRQVFHAEYNGWGWIYQSIAHAQSFKCTGTQIKKMSLRVARLNDNKPQAPLDVEIRDASLTTIYAVGQIPVSSCERKFHWRDVAFKKMVDLEPGKTYVFVLTSPDTDNKSGWLINDIYTDVYPHGTKIGYHYDTFFHIEFTGGKTIHVGPKDDQTKHDTPINSGAAGGAAVPGAMITQAGPLPAAKFVKSKP
ncbi:MAG: HEAT repeat domain-containing protein [Gemmataceae bacterium]